jgi:hypothetical protein
MRPAVVRLSSAVATGIALLLAAAPAAGQIPESFSNLQVFPEEIARGELVGAMRAFTSSLGVRCNHCHVGEDPDSLEGYDFASDDKETKRTARAMLRMVEEINGRLLPATGREDLIEVGCMTCHRGVLKPVALVNLLRATLDSEGLEATIARYRQLREEHYGGGAYDFGPATLDELTETLAAGDGGLDAARALNDLNHELHPPADYALYLRSRLKWKAGDRAGAIATLELAIEANPEVGWLRPQLEALLETDGE